VGEGRLEDLQDLQDLLVVQGTTKSTRKKSQEGEGGVQNLPTLSLHYATFYKD